MRVGGFLMAFLSYMLPVSDQRSVCGRHKANSTRYAVVTMVGRHQNYVIGANVLVHSLHNTMNHTVRRHTHFIALKVDDTKHALSPLWTVCEPPEIGSLKDISIMFEKLWVYQLLDFERVLFIDADAFVVGDVSPLLTMPGLKSIAVTPDWFETKPLVAGSNIGFNTGVFSVKPDKDEFFRINKFRLEHPELMQEQSLLNSYYGDAGRTYMGNSGNVTWFNFSFNAWLNGLADGDLPSRGNWDEIWSAYPSKIVYHLIGHMPPTRPEAVTNERSAVYKQWWNVSDDAERLSSGLSLSQR
jgi:hypothetical protein